MWPRKIALFGGGSGRLPTPVPQENFVKQWAERRETWFRDNKREFMQQAAVAMLYRDNGRSPNIIADTAEEIWMRIEERVARGDKR